MQITLLTKPQVRGNDALAVLKKTGTFARSTDFVRLQGSDVHRESLAGDCYYWLASPVNATVVNVVNMQGQVYQTESFRNKIASRPVLLPGETSKIKAQIVSGRPFGKGKSVKVAHFGMYPQTIVRPEYAKQLEKNFKRNAQKKNGYSFTFDANRESCQPFKPQEYPCYEKDGVSYIRVIANRDYFPRPTALGFPGERNIKHGDVYRVKVEPIEWLVDNSGIWVSQKVLFSGIQILNCLKEPMREGHHRTGQGVPDKEIER